MAIPEGVDDAIMKFRVAVLMNHGTEAARAALVQAIEGAIADERAAIAEQSRRYAGHYPQSSDGRNTFVMLAEWIEARP